MADDNKGAISSGGRGQINVEPHWETSTELVVAYPEKARVFKQESRGPIRSTFDTQYPTDH